jgi:vancomycin permeability regulator SanA
MSAPPSAAPPASLFQSFRRTAAVAGALGTVTVAGSVGYVRTLARGHLYRIDDVPPAPVGLVLGALVYPDGTPCSFLRARLDLGRELYERGKVGMLLLSGDHASSTYDEPSAMRNYLLQQGVAESALVTDPAGFDTYDSCVRARDVYGVTSAIMITQTYHLPRAVGTARAVGLDAVGVGDDTVRSRRRPWIKGVLRDQLACVKTVADLGTHRQPTVSTPTDAVQRALSTPGGNLPSD